MQYILLILLVFCALPAAADPSARGDSLYALRATGATEHRARPEPIAAAIAAYEQAVVAHPRRIAARWKLLRALFFAAQYTGRDAAERKRLFAAARERAEEAQGLAAEQCGGERVWRRGTRAELAAHCDPGEAAQLYLWSAVIWIQWGHAHGAVAALGAGMAGRIHDYGRRVVALDPDCERGGGQRLLSGLHGRLPRVPLVTGFVRREKALPLAREALDIDPEHPGNRFLYAAALLRHDPDRRGEALALLRALAAEEPRGPWRVEWSDLRRRARERLAAEDGD